MQNVAFKLMIRSVNADRNVIFSSYVRIPFDSNSRNVALTLGVRPFGETYTRLMREVSNASERPERCGIPFYLSTRLLAILGEQTGVSIPRS